MEKRLFRSQRDRMIGGVCGGLGAYLGVDPTIIRIFFFLLVFGGSAGFWIYLLLWFLIPEADKETPKDFGERIRTMAEDFSSTVSKPHPQSGMIIGGGLVLLGVFWLIEQLELSWLWWLDFDILWPALLIIAGGFLLFRWFSEQRERND